MGTPQKYRSRIGTDYSIDYPAVFADPEGTADGQGASVAGTVLRVRDLAVSYTTRSGEPAAAIRDVDLDIRAGGITAVVGESGSGKSTTAGAVIGLLASNAQVTSGEIRLGAHGEDPELDLRSLTPAQWQKVRGARIGYIPQDPGTSLNPLKTVGANVAESLRLHTSLTSAQRRERVHQLLDRVGIDRPQMRAQQYPHELSGGMRQRALIAAAISLDPQLLIADEPTSALDVTVQKRILDLLDDLRREANTGILFITHDLAVAAERADDLVVVRGGIVEERGPAQLLLSRPESAYTRRLLADAPSMQALTGLTDGAEASTAASTSAPASDSDAAAQAPLVEVRGLTQVFARVPREETLGGEPGAASAAGAASGTGTSAEAGGTQSAIIGIEDVTFSVPAGTTLG
ncbi:MAG TPA: ABC transporter ATP-binding protein, partial [Candidatus Brevibacterium intestinigallinarum]|nr:ABC transporter ATP-binding protein [Candidatus Brevibacterium intestinigallinarum]